MRRLAVIQSFRSTNVPGWIEHCLASVKAWAKSAGHDYRLFGDEAFEFCGADYLAQVGSNMRSITNLARLELVKHAHSHGYDWAVWIDADILVFDPVRFDLSTVQRYAFARETWLEPYHDAAQWRAFSAVNNSVFACRAGEPDLNFLIGATRHIAAHRKVETNYQVGGHLIKGLRLPLGFETLGNVGMFSNFATLALARGVDALLKLQARYHGTPVYAANLCASENYSPPVSEAEAEAAIRVLETTRGGVINEWLGDEQALPEGNEILFAAPELKRQLGIA